MKIDSDTAFDSLLKEKYAALSDIHWTPFDIAKKSAELFKQYDCTNIVDIGSGVGKFCLISSLYHSVPFTGIELRSNLVQEAKRLNKLLRLHCQFKNANITTIDLHSFDGIFYYNPFCEQEALKDFIDTEIQIKSNLIGEYNESVYFQLKSMKSGTVLLTFRSPTFQPPDEYKLLEIFENEELVVWRN